MKISTKQQAIIYGLITILAVVSFGLVFYSQTKEVKVSKLNKEALNNVSDKEANIFTDDGGKTRTPEEVEVWKEEERILKTGETTQLEDGWKRYINRYYKYQYDFLDKEDFFQVGISRKATDGNLDKLRMLPSVSPGTISCNRAKNLKEYLDAGCWKYEPSYDKLVSLEKVKNNIEMYRVDFLTPVTYGGGKMMEGEFSEVVNYYIEYEEPEYIPGTNPVYGFIYVRCNEEQYCNQVVKSFKFIE